MNPGKYIALKELCGSLRKSNGDSPSSLVETWEIEPGETFEIPRTINGFFYSIETWAYDDDEPYLVEMVKGVDYDEV